jgi:hypothetical protein
MLGLKLALRRGLYLLRSLFPRTYTVGASPAGWRRSVLRRHNQRRERGNVALYTGRRRGRYNATR